MCTADGRVLGSVAEALRMANATMDYLNRPAGDDLDAAACGLVLRSLGEIEATFTAAHASVLARFDAADAHDGDGYGTSAAWLMAMTDMTRPDAKVKVRRMRLLRDHPEMAAALADAGISTSQALAIVEWTKKLPAELRAETIRILVQAAQSARRWMTCGSSRRSRSRSGAPRGPAPMTTGSMTGTWRVGRRPGKRPRDPRTEGQRFHDALQAGCELLIRAKMVPDRGGADTHVAVHIPFPELRQRPGAPEAEEVWLRGEPGYLTGKDAEAAACDAVAVPVVTGHADMRVVDKIIALALAAAGLTLDGADPDPAADGENGDPDGTGPHDGDHDDAGTAVTVTSLGYRGRRRGAPTARAASAPAAAPGNGSPRTPPRRCATPSPGWPSTSSPARPAWPAGCAPPCSRPPTAPRRCRWTSGIPIRSRPASAAPSSSATAAARGPGAGGPPPGATCTT